MQYPVEKIPIIVHNCPFSLIQNVTTALQFDKNNTPSFFKVVDKSMP